MSDGELILPIRVYYEDTDAQGVVYYANYLRFLERARTEWLRQQGINQTQLRGDQGLVFVVHGINLKFRAPARFDDMVYATAIVRRHTAARFFFEQRITRDTAAGPVLVEGEVEAACLDVDSFRPRRLPKTLIDELMA